MEPNGMGIPKKLIIQLTTIGMLFENILQESSPNLFMKIIIDPCLLNDVTVSNEEISSPLFLKRSV